MGDFKFNCPHCQKPLKAPQKILGTTVNCPSCNGVIKLPDPIPQPQEAKPPQVVPSPSATEKKQDEEWFYAASDQQLGPISQEAIMQKIDVEEITATTLLWKEGMAAWTPAGQTVFSASFSKPSPPPLQPSTHRRPPSLPPQAPQLTGATSVGKQQSLQISPDSPEGAIDDALLASLLPDLQLVANEELFFFWRTLTAAKDLSGWKVVYYNLMVSSRRVLAIAKDKTGKMDKQEFSIERINRVNTTRGVLKDTLEIMPQCVKYGFITNAPKFKREYLPAIVEYVKKCKGGFDTPTNFSPTQASAPGAPEPANDDAIRCPRCGSSTVEWDKTKFGMGKAVVGTLLLGPLGGLVGLAGKKKIVFTCLKCGNTWKPGQ